MSAAPPPRKGRTGVSEHYEVVERPATLEEIAQSRGWNVEEAKDVDRLVRQELGRLVGVRPRPGETGEDGSDAGEGGEG